MAKRPLGAVFVVFFFLTVPMGAVHAAEISQGEGFANAMLNVASKALFGIANFAMSITMLALRLFIELAAYNNYITSPPVIVGWFMVRDVANMFFIVVLLIIAFATVLGIESYEWKKTLGKLILAAILINFSKLILQLIIDIANIFTVTFLNAVRATAAGNLINMFNFDTMLQIRQNANLTGTSDFQLDIFVASVTAVILATLSMFVIGAYAMVLVVRVVVLWVLMILSPLAFLLQAVPAGQKYAQEFWSEFTKHVMVAPLMTFFLWLTFATLGNGDIASSIGINTSAVSEAGANAPQIQGIDGNPSIALSQASTWESLSNFIIALGFLAVGVVAVQRLNVQAGGAIGSAVTFGKRVATIATGYAAGRYLVGKGADVGIGLGKGIGYRVPIVGGASLQKYGAAIKQQYKQKGVAGLVGLESKSKLLGGNIGKIAAVERAKKLEEKGGFFNKLAARMIEPTERVTKMKEDYDKTIEHNDYVLAESLSTSGTRSGQIKLNAIIDRNRQEMIAENKGNNKAKTRVSDVNLAHAVYQEMYGDQEKAINSNSLLTKEQKNKKIERLRTDSKTAEAVGNEIKNRMRAEGKSDKDIEKHERLLAEGGGMSERIVLGHKYAEAVRMGQAEKASAEQLSMEQDDAIRMQEAIARDKILINQKEQPKYVALEEERLKKRYEEEFAGKNYSEATNAPRSIIKDLKEPNRSEKERNILLKRMAASLTYNMSQGAEQGMDALGGALEELGSSYEQMLSEGFSEKEMLMAVLSGQNLEDEKRGAYRDSLSAKGGMDKMFEKWKNDIGGDSPANAVLRGLDNALKKVTIDGGVGFAGILDGEDVKEGLSQMKLKDDPSGSRSYFAKRQQLGTMTDVDQIAGRGERVVVLDESGNEKKDAKGKTMYRYKMSFANDSETGGIDRSDRKEMFRDTFKSMTKNTRIGSSLTTSLGNMYSDIGAEAWHDLVKDFTDESRSALEDKVLNAANKSELTAYRRSISTGGGGGSSNIARSTDKRGRPSPTSSDDVTNDYGNVDLPTS